MGAHRAASAPQKAYRAISIISALSLTGVAATMTVQGAVDTETFNAYVEQVLHLTIQGGDVLVLANLSAHRASRIRRGGGGGWRTGVVARALLARLFAH